MTREIRLLVVSLISLLSLLGVSVGQTGTAPQSNAAAEQPKVSFGREDLGRLETVISRGGESIQRHELGSLTPPGTVRFFAVAVTDPLSHQVVRGIEVQLEGDDPLDENGHCKSTIYLDEENLPKFQWELQKSVRGERRQTLFERQPWRRERLKLRSKS